MLAAVFCGTVDINYQRNYKANKAAMRAPARPGMPLNALAL